ncbi:hypothetical protein B566_EDAN015145 [Ephemera danica]|nr:hypothetical protein B566_EDAN015145 [Ephemera danica]
MSSSLDSLVKNLPKEKMMHLKKMFPDDQEWELMTRKGVFCYDYLDNLDKLKETCLPPKKEFRNKLTDEDISDEDYQHAKNVWNTFKCKNLGKYLAIYLKADVVLLTDVFEEFRAVCLRAYELDPCWYYTAPSSAWDAALKYTRVKFDLIQDQDIIEMVERIIRGCVSQCSKRYAEARNQYTIANHKPEHGSNCIAYLDANNLYKRLEKCVASIYFKDRIFYNENLCAIHFHKKTVVLNKPTYVGMAILDISKTLMYDFHYETMLPMYDYPKNHPLYNEANKKVLGMFKDETNAVPVTHFVGLRAKMYSLVYGDTVTKKAKGVKQSAIKKQITFHDYKQCLFNDENKYTNFHTIVSKKQ